MLFCGQLVEILACGRVARIMMMVAIGVGNGMVCAGLVVLQLVGMVLPKRGVEVLLLICSVFVSAIESASANVALLFTHQALDENLFLLAMP